MANPRKIEIVEELNKKLNEAKGFYLADFIGLNVEQITQLRKQLRDESIEFIVIKNTLLKRALENYPFKDIDQYLTGPNALAISYDDPLKPAKILNSFIKKYEKPQLKASVIDGKIFNLEETKQLTNLPSKEELLAKLVMLLNSPISNLVYSLQGILRKLVYVLNAVKEQKEKQGDK